LPANSSYVVNGLQFPGATGDVYFFTATDITPEQALSFYQDQLPSHGWGCVQSFDIHVTGSDLPSVGDADGINVIAQHGSTALSLYAYLGEYDAGKDIDTGVDRTVNQAWHRVLTSPKGGVVLEFRYGSTSESCA
jgi:hypothetical protein